MTAFLICKPFPCQSAADLVRSGNVFNGYYYCHGSVKDERDATRTSRMGLRTIRTLVDELRMRYGRATDTKVHLNFTEKSNSFICSLVCHYRSQYAATDLTRTLRMLQMTLLMENMIHKSLNSFHIRKPGAIRRAILGCVTGTLE